MLPRRSSSSSQRRSSILKPPKSRQPFQDLDFNTSSPENSPETTKKRRVSFAEKKHVKEFCDHKEQGTIWDSTYEEADQNVSKPTEVTNENQDRIIAGIEYTENVNIASNEAGFNFLRDQQDLIHSETYVNMDPKNVVENSGTKIFFDSGTELEFTDVIPRSRKNLNYSMSKTILCQDGDLEITEAIGGIEPTVSIKQIVNTKAKEITDSPSVEQKTKNKENTMLFDSSEAEMNFTEIISNRKVQTSTPRNVDTDQDFENTNSSIENQTIIFEDSIMELTLTKSQTELDPDPSRNIESNAWRVAGDNAQIENIDLRSEENANNSESLQANNKTIFFNDFGCDMTEAINTVMHQVPEIDLVKEKPAVEFQTVKNSSVETCAEPRQDNCSIKNEAQNLSNGSDSTLTNSDMRNNKTIFFNDFGCEMTEAINTLKTSRAVENVVDKYDAEQIVPQQSLAVNSITDVQMEIKPEEILSNSLRSKPEVESSPELISTCSNRTELFNDSAMEFTTAVTRENNVENELPENCTLERNKTVVFDNCNVDITEAVKTPPCSLNSGSNSEEKDDLLSTEFKNSELQINKKRKSVEREADIDCNRSSNSSMSKSVEHDLVQSLVQDELTNLTNDNLSNTFAPNCKRLKITSNNDDVNGFSSQDCFVNVQSELLENTEGKTIDLSPPTAQEMPEMQLEISSDLQTANDSIISVTENHVENIEDVAVAAALESDNDQGRLVIDKNVEAKGEESLKPTEDDVSEEESFIMRTTLGNLDSDSDSDALELSHVYEKQHKSLVDKTNDAASRLEPNKCLEYNDDCCFVMFSEELEKQAKKDNCIWTIRSLDTKKVLIDFISKSLVVIIHLEPSEELTTPRTIKDIKIVSLLPDSADGDISMIHNILLKKFDEENLKQPHRTTQDILPLLELISQRVKLLMDFMCEFDNLQDLHLINRSGNRISFRLHSYKVQLVIKITIDLEPFEDIGPNDVEVECILGNIREKDIKQLITSVKKDHRFLTNYIDDIKEYIAIVVEK